MITKGSITTARIHNLEGYPVWDNHCGYYILPISFIYNSYTLNEIQLFLSTDEDTAEETCCTIREKFKNANVFEGSNVTLYLSNRGKVKGIRSKKRHLGGWLDVLNGLNLSSLSKIMN